MELILVRHACPASDGTPSRDPSLSDRGRRQARRVCDWLAHDPIDVVLSSPARRAVETAEPLAARLGLEVLVDERLRDANLAGDRYVPIEVDRARDPAAYRARTDAYQSSPRMREVQARVNASLDEWCAKARGGRIVAFCHGSVVNVFAARVLGLPSPGFLEAGFASGHRFLVSSSGLRSVQSLNETAYLVD